MNDAKKAMTGIADTIARLSAMGAMPMAGRGTTDGAALGLLSDFGNNPGALLGRTFVPADLAPGAALVVVLHGCTQTAAGYDRGAGWSQLAAEAGFAVLFPEQQRANNPNLCFNWFERGDVTRGQGEGQSIREMVAEMLSRHDLDAARVYVTGLSAGGAMAAALLAAYPDVFAGGAIIAGLPDGSAEGVAQALQRMRSAAPVRTAGLGNAIRAATGHVGAWPTVSVWHGDADHIVHPSNGAVIVEQWRAIHGVNQVADERQGAGHTRHVWRDRTGREVVEQWTIAGMGHGTPLATAGSDACGAAGPHMLDVGISSTRHIARFWGLLPAVRQSARIEPDPVRSARCEPDREEGARTTRPGWASDERWRTARPEAVSEERARTARPEVVSGERMRTAGPELASKERGRTARPDVADEASTRMARPEDGTERADKKGERTAWTEPTGPGAVIEQALRAAGLMK